LGVGDLGFTAFNPTYYLVEVTKPNLSSVDLGTPDSLNNYLKEAVLKEAVRAI